MAEIQLNLVVLRSADIERSVQFYGMLGLEFLKHRHGAGSEHYSCESGPVVFGIYPRLKELEESSGVRIGFQVASVDAAVTALEKVGARIISGPKQSPWGRRAVVDDPDGHRVELTELAAAG